MSAEELADFLDEQRDAAPAELQGTILEIETLWERKLWHQLTDTLIALFDEDQSEDLRLPFFKVFVLKFADKINQLKFVDLALKAAESCGGEFWILRDLRFLGDLPRSPLTARQQ